MKAPLTFGTILLMFIQLPAQQPALVEDNAPFNAARSSNPSGFTQSGNYVYFVAGSFETEGTELWRTDGTEQGTELIHDIKLGLDGGIVGFSASMASSSGMLYFNANDGEVGNQLWRTDGTVQGTFIVNTVDPDAVLNPKEITALNNEIIFAGNDDSLGIELWISDGTEAGTKVLKDIRAGSADSDVKDIVAAGAKAFFLADGVFGEELYVTDGTTAGTQLVKDINPGGADANIRHMTAIGGKLYFQANDGTHGFELWVSDGTQAGTMMIKDINPGTNHSYPEYMTGFKGEVYFSATAAGSGTQLWKTDGTSVGTVPVNPGGDPNGPDYLYNVNDQYLIYAAMDATNGTEIWKSDGTPGGTALLKDLNPGSDDSDPQAFVVVGNHVLFHATDGSQKGTWAMDAQENFQFIAPYFFPETDRGIIHNGKLIFPHSDNASGSEPWVTDGTIAGTKMIKNIAVDKASGNPFRLKSANGELFFAGTDTSGIGLQVITNGKSEFLLPLIPIGNGSITFETAELNGKTIISAYTELGEYPLFTSDGTAAGTVVLDTSVFYAGGFVKVGNRLIFLTQGTFSYEYWQTDGTTAGTDTILSGFTIDNVRYFGALGHLFFVGSTDSIAKALWKYDPSSGQTSLVKSIPLTLGTYINFIREWNGELYFTAREQGSGYELWKTDGTEQGTIALKELYLFSGLFSLLVAEGNFTELNGELYFMADDGITGNELWKTDGSPNGTVQVKDINPGQAGSNLLSLTTLNNKLLFSNYTEDHGRELWVSDGTAAGTHMLKDILPGKLSGVAGFDYPFVEYGNNIYFVANDGQNGTELWKTDGTDTGTQMVADIHTGYRGSCPRELTVADSVLYFSAFHPDYGRELWAIGLTVGIEQPDHPVLHLQVYPNPARNQVTVQLPDPAIDQLEVIDLTGRTVIRKPVTRQTQHTISTPTLPGGFYIIRAMQDGRTIAITRWMKAD